MNKLVKENGSVITRSTDALTILMGSKNSNDMNIFLCIFEDRIFFDENNVERTDGFTRLSVALAHEIYGNTQMYIKQDLSSPSTTKLPTRKQAEINAFTAGVNFINKVLLSFKSGLLSNYPNKDKLVGDFNNALKREKIGLAQWQKASDDPNEY